MIQPFQKSRVSAAEITSCQRSPRTIKWRCLSRARCYLLQLKQQVEWKKESTPILSELYRTQATDRPENPKNHSQIFKMVDPLQYCGRAKVLDKFLETLRSNFPPHKHWFLRGDRNYVKCAVSFLHTKNYHPDPTQQHTELTDPSKWATDRRETKDPCREDFELLANQPQNMYRDRDRHPNSATKAMQEYHQLPNESVQVYANRLKANWRRAGWNLIMHEVVL